jgi:hypothetical protein
MLDGWCSFFGVDGIPFSDKMIIVRLHSRSATALRRPKFLKS